MEHSKKPLEISVRVRPHPKTLSTDEFNALMDGELERFNVYLQQRAAARGDVHSALITPEKAAIKAWAWYMAEQVEE